LQFTSLQACAVLEQAFDILSQGDFNADEARLRSPSGALRD
jgi:hypothetical protein